MPWTTATTRSSGFTVTAAVWNSEHVDNMNFLKRVNYTEYTADVSVTATTVATANQIVSAGAITYENVPHEIEFYCPQISSINADVNIILRDSTTVLGTIEQIATGSLNAACFRSRRLTPSAASHTYNIAAWLGGADTVVFNAGTGGAAGDATTFFPGYIEIRRIPT